MGLIYATQAIVTGCQYPMWMQWAGIVYGFTIIALFINFYIQAYIKKRPEQVTSPVFPGSLILVPCFSFCSLTMVGTVCGWHRPCASVPCHGMRVPAVDALGAHFLCIHHPYVLRQLLLPRLCEGSAPQGNSLVSCRVHAARLTKLFEMPHCSLGCCFVYACFVDCILGCL